MQEQSPTRELRTDARKRSCVLALHIDRDRLSRHGYRLSKPQIPGLIDVYDSNLTDSEGQLTGSKRGQNGGVTAGWRSAETRMDTGADGVSVQKYKNGASVVVNENQVVAARRNHAGVR